MSRYKRLLAGKTSKARGWNTKNENENQIKYNNRRARVLLPNTRALCMHDGGLKYFYT